MTQRIQMGRPRYTAARLPYPLERNDATNSAEQRRRAQRILASLNNRYENVEDLALPHYGHARRGETKICTGRGIANRDRGFYPPSESWYNDLDSLEPGRLRPYRGRRLSGSAHEELDFIRHGHRLSRGPTSYDAADDRSLFDDERGGSFRGCGLGNSQLPFYPSDIESRDFDEETFLEANPHLRYPHPRPGPLGSHDISLDYWIGPESGHKWRSDPALYDSYDDLNLAPRRDSRDFGRVGARVARRFHPDYPYDDDLEGDDLGKNFRETRQSRRPRHARHCSDLDFRFVDDDIEDDVIGDRRASTAARSRHRVFPVQRYSDGIDGEDRKRERQDSLAAGRYTEEDFDIGVEEDSDIGEIARGLLDRCGQIPRANMHCSTASLSDNDVEESLLGRRDYPFRPCRVGPRSDLDYFIADKGEDEYGRKLRAPVAAERRRSPHHIQGHGEMDAEHQEREWERQLAQLEEQYTKKSTELKDTSCELRDRRGQMAHPNRPRRAADTSDDDLEESPRGRHGRPFRPRQARNQQNSRRRPRGDVKGSKSEGRDSTQQAPPSYESVTPAQATARMHSQPSTNPHRTSVETALSNLLSRPYPTAPIVAEDAPKGAAKDIPHHQQQVQDPIGQAKNEETAHNDAGEEIDSDRFDSSDSGCDTPDEDSDVSRAGDENSECGHTLQSLIRITL